MFSENDSSLLSGARRQRLSAGKLMIFAVALLLFTCIPSYGQMGNSVIYSDSWVDSSSSPIYVVGVGITSDSYNTYGHQYWVNTTVTSPSGRYSGGQSWTSSSYARVDVYLDWGFEFGDFTVHTTHSMTCPYIYNVVNGFTGVDIWLTRSSYVGTGQDASGACLFELQCAPGTSATCGLAQTKGLPVGTTCAQTWGKHFWCLDVSYNGICVKYTTICVGPWNLPQACS